MRTIKLIAALLLAGSQLPADTHELPADLFDGIAQHSDSTVRLHGLAALYPGRVLFEEPRYESNQERSEAARVETIRDEISYIRVYRFAEAMQTIQKHLGDDSLILDLRYMQSADLGSELSFSLDRGKSYNQLISIGTLPDDVSAALAMDVDAASPSRKSAVIVLCNRETAGPFEALLHNLQTSGAVIAVGEATAGRTGFYREIDAAWLINGEIQPTDATSLVGVGFVPRIEVKLSPEEHYTAYHWYEAGSSLEQTLISMQSTDKAEQPHPSIDPILERGVEIVAALQILQPN